MPGHPHPWHRGSVFGDGLRIPLCRERRAVWKARIKLHRRARSLSHGAVAVAEVLLKRLGVDGRCDPSHQTLSDDSGESVDTVKRALKALHRLGMLDWLRRIVRIGECVRQTSNAYVLRLGRAPQLPSVRCEVDFALGTGSFDKSKEPSFVPAFLAQEVTAAQAALAERRRVVEARLLSRGCRGGG